MSFTSKGSIQVTQRIEFECCYLTETEVEAHRYRVEATVESPQHYQDHGVVLRFDEFKKYLFSVVPHCRFVINGSISGSRYESDLLLLCNQLHLNVLEVDFKISAETLCNYIAERLQATFNQHEPGVILTDIKLRENNDSFVSWSKT